jgi:acetyl esterase
MMAQDIGRGGGGAKEKGPPPRGSSNRWGSMAFNPNEVNLDPEAKALLDLVAKAGRIPFSQLTPPTARAQFAELCRRTRKPCDWDVAASDHAIPGPGGSRNARRYLPRRAGPAPLPALLYFHGGGWCIGDVETHDALCRQIAHEAQCAVLSLDYRLAPEHPFPAAVEDCFAALCFAAAEGRSLGLDPARLAVGGDSAGGNLAAVVALLAREAGIAVAGQVLFYPATDFVVDYPSRRDYGAGFLLTRESTDWFGGHYVDPCRHEDWRASPLRAPDLGRLPPSIVIVGGCDMLCDESRAYAEALARAGNAVSFHVYPGMIHGFLTMGGVIAAADKAVAQSAAFLQRVLAS